MRALAWVIAIFLARAATAAEPMLIAPGPEGEDVSVYSFLPSTYPPDPPRGSGPKLYAVTVTFLGFPHDFRSFLQFPLPESVAGACVESATLVVYFVSSASPYPGELVPGELWVHEVLDPWTEDTTKWASQPSFGPMIDAVTGIEIEATYLELDVTSIVQHWADGAPNYGFALTSPTPRVLGFPSFESPGDPIENPALSITLADDPQACPEPAWAAPVAIAALLSLKRRHS